MNDARSEFAQVLRELGGVVDGEHPIMDGTPHRLATHDDKRGERTIFYIGHLDGVPNGYAENNRTKEVARWKARNVDQLNDRDIKADIEKARAERLRAQTSAHEATAERLANGLSVIGARITKTEYHDRKGIEPTPGAPARHGTVLVPGYDIEGKLWTVQYIAPDGTKRFAKDSRKTGCFHVVGAQDGRAARDLIRGAQCIVIAEGYATAATVTQRAGILAVAAFDSGNLLAVARAIRHQYPDKQIIVAGDDDHRIASNPGRAKAIEAAKAVKGRAVFPWLSRKQKAERLTDFNDVPPETLKTQFGALMKQVNGHEARSR